MLNVLSISFGCMSPFRWKIEVFSLPFSDSDICASRGVYYVGTLRVEASLLGRSMCVVTGFELDFVQPRFQFDNYGNTKVQPTLT